ncbi:MAG: hypothetical protein J7598_18890 [Mitsuaria chitosanitabida]|uniref:sulfatase-like hydrolase/transferase n=1 Tax=Roseateles chitosanitabidus TaxID=65048 RepID=UPI001B015B80|nr:sulfatase-like hydrolase/transferase [Roseateles chitosanitabidus]MBO9688673.1 hypothetical protein [Roseateles chitosanitabidus]
MNISKPWRSFVVGGAVGGMSWRDMGTVAYWRYLLLLNIGVQLPFWIAKSFYSFQRPVFNEDLAIALLGFAVSSWLGWILLGIALVVDVLRIASLNYHFLNLADFVESVRFVHLLNLWGMIRWEAVLGVGLAIGFLTLLALSLRRLRPMMFWGQLALLMLMGLVDALNGSMRLGGGGLDRFHFPVNVAGSPIWNLYRVQMATEDAASEPLRPVNSAVNESIRRWHAANPDGSVMLVLVESMGQPVSPVVRTWLGNQLQSPGVSNRWRFQQGSEPFQGSTTHGELRVLCALDGPYGKVTAAQAPECLPGQLAKDGVVSAGFHGFQLSMFDRDRWWKALGLRPHAFDYHHAGSAVRDCHDVFHGICDREVLRQAAIETRQPRRLAYVVTLDTHLPLPSSAKNMSSDAAAMCERERLSESACELVAQLGRLMNDLRDEVSSQENTPFVAVVGDHAPPFLTEESRSAFDSREVPYFLLEPR